MAAKKNKGLGKGLDALFENSTVKIEEKGETVLDLCLEDIHPLEDQPRKHFDEEKLQELAASIEENGVIQPIIVRETGARSYEIIAGERRWRAAQLAGLNKIPAIVRDLDEEMRLRQALVENIQREDLNPMEEAKAFQQLMDEHDLTQEELATILGKSRPAVANTLRLNKLPEELQDFLAHGDITAGHARALLALETEEEQIRACDEVLRLNLNVRETERLVQKLQLEKTEPAKEPAKEEKQRELAIQQVETRISQSMGTKVRLKDKKGKGEIRIPYKDYEELDRMLELFDRLL